MVRVDGRECSIVAVVGGSGLRRAVHGRECSIVAVMGGSGWYVVNSAVFLTPIAARTMAVPPSRDCASKLRMDAVSDSLSPLITLARDTADSLPRLRSAPGGPPPSAMGEVHLELRLLCPPPCRPDALTPPPPPTRTPSTTPSLAPRGAEAKPGLCSRSHSPSMSAIAYLRRRRTSIGGVHKCHVKQPRASVTSSSHEQSTRAKRKNANRAVETRLRIVRSHRLWGNVFLHGDARAKWACRRAQLFWLGIVSVCVCGGGGGGGGGSDVQRLA
jgi:hypothetical protein